LGHKEAAKKKGNNGKCTVWKKRIRDGFIRFATDQSDQRAGRWPEIKFESVENYCVGYRVGCGDLNLKNGGALEMDALVPAAVGQTKPSRKSYCHGTPHAVCSTL